MAAKTFTYSGDPSESPLMEVRFLVGDTIKERVLFDDREIAFQLTKTPNTKMAGSALLNAKAAEFAAKADIRVGDISKSLSQISKQMKACAKSLRDDALNSVRPFFGGLTKSGKEALSIETDDVQPAFAIGITDDPTVVQLNRDLSYLYGLGGV